MPERQQENGFRCDLCGMSFSSDSQLNAHKVSDHAVAGGELTTR
ncbi:hypothetical protein [Candidatus Nitrososphaera gargensis]|nr:hypothetical protein [Candidatus Nitrososphaera gargensis]